MGRGGPGGPVGRLLQWGSRYRTDWRMVYSAMTAAGPKYFEIIVRTSVNEVLSFLELNLSTSGESKFKSHILEHERESESERER